MKKEIAAYFARCDTCCRVKAVHLKPTGLLQPLSVLGWKLEEISMDFIIGLPPNKKGYNSIWVFVDRLTKPAHFIPVQSTYRPSDYAELYFSQIIKLHGVPRTIISDRGPQFTARFWEHLHSLLGTQLVRSSAYHPQTSGQTECVNQILEDMLRACVISSKGAWEKWLLLGILNANRKIRKHTDTDVAFTREYSRVSIFHRERECTN